MLNNDPLFSGGVPYMGGNHGGGTGYYVNRAGERVPASSHAHHTHVQKSLSLVMSPAPLISPLGMISTHPFSDDDDDDDDDGGGGADPAIAAAIKDFRAREEDEKQRSEYRSLFPLSHTQQLPKKLFFTGRDALKQFGSMKELMKAAIDMDMLAGAMTTSIVAGDDWRYEMLRDMVEKLMKMKRDGESHMSHVSVFYFSPIMMQCNLSSINAVDEGLVPPLPPPARGAAPQSGMKRRHMGEER